MLETSKGPLRFLIDTGANKNYLDPKHVNYEKCRTTTPLKVRNVSGSHKIDRFVEFNPFPQLSHPEKATFFVFHFHPFFDGLIGYETLKNLKANILTETNELEILNEKIKMYRKYPEIEQIHLNSNETKAINLPLTTHDGDFFLDNDLFIQNNVIIHSGLYNARHNQARVIITNYSSEPCKIKLDQHLLTPEMNNFETSTPDDTKHQPASSLYEQLRISHLDSDERSKLLKLINKYEDVFFIEGDKLTFTSAIKHAIKTNDDLPVHAKSYRYPFCHRKEVQNQISKMLEQGIIQHSISPWTSPVWIVPKKLDASGVKKWRLVIDYRKLNEKTVDDRYPIPNITDILDKLGRCMYFTTLDLASGFHQVEINKKDIPKTAFSVENGHYEFLRMPFGLKNAPSTFQRVMDNVLREHIGVICLVYMDDIIIFSTSLTEHIDNLGKIFKTLQKHNLKVQLDKSEFLQKEVAFLGHIVTTDGVKPNPDKIQTIQNWPLPSNEKELRGFLGILGYYRKFIRDFAKIAKPLTNALRKGEGICHTKEFLDAFTKCKQILTGSDILQYPDFSKQFILTTDASNFAVGAVLSQGTIGHDKPIAFASRTLNKSEEKYSAIEKELLAVVWACKYFRPYLYGRKFILYTDHKPLTYGLNLKDTNNRLVHWRLALSEFDYEIRYRPGKQNVVADSLSRIKTETEINIIENESSDDATAHSADTDDSEFIPCTESPVNAFCNQIVLKIGPDATDNYEEIFPRVFRRTITRLIFGVPVIFSMFKDYMDPKRTNCIYCPENLIGLIQTVYKNYFSRAKAFKICISQKLLIDLRSAEEQNLAIERTHASSHRGIWENNQQISKRFFFPKMKTKIRSYIKLCETCHENKYDRHPYKIKLGSTPNPARPLDIVHIDIFIAEKQYFLSAVDKFSRYGSLTHIKTRNITDIRKALTKFFGTFGTPRQIICDKEPALRSIEVRGLLHDLNVDIFFTPPNHSESNGIVERFHSTIAEIFRCIRPRHEGLSVKEVFYIACTQYNNSIHSAIKIKPREAFYGLKDGQERPLDIELMMQCRNKIYDEIALHHEKSKEKNLNYHNKNRESEPTFEANQTKFNRVQGIKQKTKPKYSPIIVAEDSGRLLVDDSGREIHKENIKRI